MANDDLVWKIGAFFAHVSILAMFAMMWASW